MHKSTLETHSLDGASRIVTMAERLADEEMDTLKMEKPNAIPGESPAWNVAYAAGNEARRIANLQKAAADTVSMRRDELEGALSPLVSFKSIMHAAGQCSTDIDAGDVAGRDGCSAHEYLPPGRRSRCHGAVIGVHALFYLHKTERA